VDVDGAMVEMYNKRIGELGGKHKDTCAVVGNLLEEHEVLEGEGFDLITVGAALHAFPSAGDAVKCLASRLAPGGVLFVQDRFDDGEYGGRGPMMSAAELEGVRFEVLPEKLEIEVMDGKVVSIWCLVARGMKPDGSGLEIKMEE
jgi:SAM-dependent methyltransferase